MCVRWRHSKIKSLKLPCHAVSCPSPGTRDRKRADVPLRHLENIFSIKFYLGYNFVVYDAKALNLAVKILCLSPFLSLQQNRQVFECFDGISLCDVLTWVYVKPQVRVALWWRHTEVVMTRVLVARAHLSARQYRLPVLSRVIDQGSR